jgi:hypothetical protein
VNRRAGAIAIVAMLVMAPRRASADNTEPFYYSDDAALTAGTVVATSHDAGSIWYNPAGLGGLKHTHFDLSGSAFGVRIRNVPDAVVTTLPNGNATVGLQSTDIFSAPHALGIVRALSSNVSLGIGLFVTARDIRTSSSEVTVGGGTNQVFLQRLDFVQENTRYHAGPAIGWEISPGLRVGAAIFGTYGKGSLFSQFAFDAEADAPGAHGTGIVFAQNRLTLSYFGGQAHAGIQWEPSPEWVVGVLVRSPELLFSTTIDTAETRATATAVTGKPGQASFSLQEPNPSLPAFTIIAPLRGVAGAAYRIEKETWIGAEVDVQAPYSNQGIEGATVVNGRVGGRIQATETIGVGLGFFTDRTTLPSLGNNFTDEQIDEYGLSTGIEIRTPLALASREASDPLVLSTTVAIKYAIGFGQFRALDIDAVNGTNPPPRVVDVVYHTILPYIGSSVVF